MLPFLFNHSACSSLHSRVPPSVCSETSSSSSLGFSLLSPPRSLLSQQKSIPVHSLCQHFSSLPSLFVLIFSVLHTYSLSIYLNSQQATLQLCIQLPHWEAHLLNVMDFDSGVLSLYEVFPTFEYCSRAHTCAFVCLVSFKMLLWV